MTINCFDNLGSLLLDEETQPMAVTEDSVHRNHDKKIALTIGYLLGVRDDFLSYIYTDKEQRDHILSTLTSDENAVAIRALNNIRTNLMLWYKVVSRTTCVMSADYKPLYKMEQFEADFKTLGKLEIGIYVSGNDINEYLRRINAEIGRRIDSVQKFFPEWVKFRHIRFMFSMPSDIENEVKKFQSNQLFYPYRRYFNWIYPEDIGNILTTDDRVLAVIYQNAADVFEDYQRVIDASDKVKNNISEFIRNGNSVRIFVDGENVNPYVFTSTLESMKEHEIRKIQKIVVYYDVRYSIRAWKLLPRYACGIEVEMVPVERIKGDKSLVDHKIVAGITKAYYMDNVDSFIIASSDSDFWSVIEDIDAKFLVMVENGKCAHEFRNTLRNNNIFYCYMDLFRTPEEDGFFQSVLRKELETVLTEHLSSMNGRKMLQAALFESRAEISQGAFECMYNKFLRNLRITFDKSGKPVFALAAV